MTNLVRGMGLALLVAAAACGKDDAGSGGGGGGGGAAKPAGPLKMTAAELWKDYSSLDGMKVLEKYRDPMVVTGNVKQVMGADDPATPLILWLDVDGTKYLDIGFTDQGAALRAKGVKVGDPVTATCKVAGQADNFMQLTDCAL